MRSLQKPFLITGDFKVYSELIPSDMDGQDRKMYGGGTETSNCLEYKDTTGNEKLLERTLILQR